MTATAAPAIARDQDLDPELVTDTVHLLALSQIHESPDNPRQTFDQAKLVELAESLKKGQMVPCLVRPRPKGGFELAAGHRRFRAAKLAGLESLRCIVQEMDDVRFLEVLVVENNQREDVHPLEEARGYAALLKSIGGGYDPAKIAGRIGRSVKYVYDRIKLLELTKDVQQLFLAGDITAGHAILLARLDEPTQKDISKKNGGVLWGPREPDVDEEGQLELPGSRKLLDCRPISVRSLADWINHHVRFDHSEPDPVLFPDTAVEIEDAEIQQRKVVSITTDYQLREDARDKNEKTFGVLSWKRVDGEPWEDPRSRTTKKLKPCEHAVLGVVVAGDGRGQAFDVCVAKEKCDQHWPKPKKKKKKASASSSSSSNHHDDWQARQRAENEKYRKREEERRAVEARWKKAMPAITKAIAERVAKLPTKADGLLASVVLEGLNIRGSAAIAGIARGKSADDLLRYAAIAVLTDEISDMYDAPTDFPKRAKAFGLDVVKILNEVAPIEKPAAAEKKGKTK